MAFSIGIWVVVDKPQSLDILYETSKECTVFVIHLHEIVRCQLMHFFENINFYIVIPPSKYDNKEILRLQGSVEGPKILRFRFL